MPMKQLLFIIMLLPVVRQEHSFFNSSQPNATIVLQFNNIAGDQQLQLDSGVYTNVAGEKFCVTLLQYFISNIQFTAANGQQYIVPQDSSYFFIQQDDSASQFCTVHVPAGAYRSVSFVVGVDSLRCTSKIDKRKGVLDPSATDMYWGWNSGYIFLKMEGISPAAPEDPIGLHKFRYHIGGFGGYKTSTINNIKTIDLDLTNNLQLDANSKATITINADILKLFNGIHQVSIAAHPSIMFDAYSSTIANNYASMFSIAAVKR
jgi:hypothetical protein